MTKLLNYLYKYILEAIISTIFKNGFHSNNEVISYSLVCKAWFEMMSIVLSNNINKYTCDDMKRFMELPVQQLDLNNKLLSSSSSLSLSTVPVLSEEKQHYQQLKQDYKIIKLKECTVLYSFYSEDQDLIELSQVLSESKHYKKVFINAASSKSSKELLEILDKVPDNVILDLYLPFFNPINNQKYIDYHYKIDTINCSDISLSDLHGLLEIPPKRVIYSTTNIFQYNNNDFYFHFELGFEATANHKIDIDYLLFPSSFHNNNNNSSTSKLEGFTLMTTIKDMMKAVPINQDSSDQVKWEYIVHKLSNDPTLKELSFKNELGKLCKEQLGSLTEDQFYGGLKSILLNQKYLDEFSIRSNHELKDPIFEGLAANRSIKTLFFQYYQFGLSNIINKVFLPNSRTIRNLIINSYNIDPISWLSLFQKDEFRDQLDLYSISIYMRESDNLGKLLDYLKSNQFSVKEFNIIDNGGSIYSFSNTIQFYINNNNIINFIKYS